MRSAKRKSDRVVTRQVHEFGLSTTPRRQDPMARLGRYIEPDPDTGCWNWTGFRNAHGYGMFTPDAPDSRTYTHRIVYEVFNGEIPEDLEIDHLCRNKSCCNPEHLEAVTHAENVRRASGARSA